MSEQVWTSMWKFVLHTSMYIHGCKHWWFLKNTSGSSAVNPLAWDNLTSRPDPVSLCRPPSPAFCTVQQLPVCPGPPGSPCPRWWRQSPCWRWPPLEWCTVAPKHPLMDSWRWMRRGNKLKGPESFSCATAPPCGEIDKTTANSSRRKK